MTAVILNSFTNFKNPKMETENHSTLYVAAWGAITGTLTFIWNVVRWRQERPNISATIEAVTSFWNEDGYACIRLALRNRGRQRTTVEDIYLYKRPTWTEFGFNGILMWLEGENAWNQRIRASNPKTVKLPAVLDVNEVWTGFIPLECHDEDDEEKARQVNCNRELINVFRSGHLRFSVQCAHTDRRMEGAVRLVEF
jgi:hypothetical protein